MNITKFTLIDFDRDLNAAVVVANQNFQAALLTYFYLSPVLPNIAEARRIHQGYWLLNWSTSQEYQLSLSLPKNKYKKRQY